LSSCVRKDNAERENSFSRAYFGAITRIGLPSSQARTSSTVST
jgi:hypothetical protein